MTPKETLYGYIEDHIEVLGENLKGSTPNNSLQQELLMIKRLLEKHDEQNKKQAKTLDILKKKCVSKGYIRWTTNYKNYNAFCDGTDYAELTQEEYDLLKEWLKND